MEFSNISMKDELALNKGELQKVVMQREALRAALKTAETTIKALINEGDEYFVMTPGSQKLVEQALAEIGKVTK